MSLWEKKPVWYLWCWIISIFNPFVSMILIIDSLWVTALTLTSLYIYVLAEISRVAAPDIFIFITTLTQEEYHTWMQSAWLQNHDQATAEIHWNAPKTIMLACVPEGYPAREATNHTTAAHSGCKENSWSLYPLSFFPNQTLNLPAMSQGLMLSHGLYHITLVYTGFRLLVALHSFIA